MNLNNLNSPKIKTDVNDVSFKNFGNCNVEFSFLKIKKQTDKKNLYLYYRKKKIKKLTTIYM